MHFCLPSPQNFQVLIIQIAFSLHSLSYNHHFSSFNQHIIYNLFFALGVRFEKYSHKLIYVAIKLFSHIFASQIYAYSVFFSSINSNVFPPFSDDSVPILSLFLYNPIFSENSAISAKNTSHKRIMITTGTSFTSISHKV